MRHRDKILATYDRGAETFGEEYARVTTPQVLGGLIERLPDFRALDLGCGTGRDAKWLAEQGFIVDAVDGSEGMLEEAMTRNSDPHVTYFKDLLPEIQNVRAKGEKYDVILLSAVWMHMKPEERAVALRHISDVAKPGAVIFISLRHGKGPEDRPMFEVSADELKRMAAYEMIEFEHLPPTKDELGRGEVWWDSVCLRKPPENLEAMRVIKEQVIQGRQSSTYKPALIISLSEAMKRNRDALEHVDAANVELPLRTIAQPWHRIYSEAAEMELPQHGHPDASLLSPLPHVKHGGEATPEAIENGVRSVLTRNGPFKHIIDPKSGKPVFTTHKGEDGQWKVRFPRGVAEAVDVYQPLVCTGAKEAIARFLEHRVHAPAEQVSSFVDRLQPDTAETGQTARL